LKRSSKKTHYLAFFFSWNKKLLPFAGQKSTYHETFLKTGDVLFLLTKNVFVIQGRPARILMSTVKALFILNFFLTTGKRKRANFGIFFYGDFVCG
jgi:hypothetical protein